MANKDGSSRIEIEERIEKAEELLCAGIAPSRVESVLAKEYDLTPRQARRYISRVYSRWQQQAQLDAPFRREKVIRMIERFYTKTMAKERFTAAAQALALLAKMSSAFTQRNPARERLLQEMGPAPQVLGEVLPFVRRILVFELREVFANAALDPERRLRWLAELSAKLGMIFSRTEIEEHLGRVEALMAAQRGFVSTIQMISGSEIKRAPGSRGGPNSRLPGSPGSDHGHKGDGDGHNGGRK